MPTPPADRPPRPEKIFPVSWDQFHRDSRALAWRLHEAGPFEAIVAITRGGLVPAAIVARELNVRLIETVCVASYVDYQNQGELKVLKGVAPEVTSLRGQGKGVLIGEQGAAQNLAEPLHRRTECCRQVRSTGESDAYPKPMPEFRNP